MQEELKKSRELQDAGKQYLQAETAADQQRALAGVSGTSMYAGSYNGYNNNANVN